VETIKKEFNFSLFKPVSEYGRKNRNIIISILIIWFVAIFGFQILLLIFEKPTPEASLVKFERVWENVKTGNYSIEDQQDFIKSIIAVEGKSILKKADKAILNNAISTMVYKMLSNSDQLVLLSYVKALKSNTEKIAKANDDEYIDLRSKISDAKTSINNMMSKKLAIQPNGLDASILPYTINDEINELSNDDIEALPNIMKLYLTHNQSFLTNTKFLGFPFHYFYTAEFLLILFVLLSLFYSIRITRLQKRYSILEEKK
jgi:putative solute:sodium symporter small subunit